MTSYGSFQGTTSASNANPHETTPLVNGRSDGNNDHVSTEGNYWSKLTFQWFTPVLHRGNEKAKLDPDDLALVPMLDDCETEHVTATFDKYWGEELGKAKPSLVNALFRAFGAEYLEGAALKLVHDLCLFVGPQVLHSMILFLRDPNAPLLWGMWLVFAVTMSQLAMSICLRHYFYKCYTTGLRTRTAIVMTVYRKALLLSPEERQGRSMGEITNLASIDAQRLQDLTTYLNAVWSSPLQIGLALFFLWRQLGPSSLGGVSVIIIMIPVTKYVATWMGKMQTKLMKAKDDRVELNAEVLGGMKVIKFQAWEESFQKRIQTLRQAELTQLLRYFLGTSFSRMLWVFTPLMVALATFSVYLWSGHRLDVASALTALSLFDLLRFPLFMLPQTINSIIEAAVSVDRLRSFFISEEHHAVGPGNLTENGININGVSAVYGTKNMEGGTNTRESNNGTVILEKDKEVAILRALLSDAEQEIQKLQGEKSMPPKEPMFEHASSSLCLRRVTFNIRPGEVVAIVGSVGCGKTSLINSILGELRLQTGKTEVKGTLAYFSQTPFIMNASVRDNILFGHVSEPIDEDLYERAVDCCALRHDMSLLPDGDQTEIGERGITLSGGQKARVALARAVYHEADITLVDDALSAVDAHVAKHLFDRAILGELMQPSISGRDRGVVFVTNALQYLNHPRINRIYVVEEGRVAEEGSYTALSNNPDSVFARILSIIKDNKVSKDLSETEDVSMGPEPKKVLDSVSSNTGHTLSSKDTKPSKLVSEELRKTGKISTEAYLSWIRASGGFMVTILILILFAAGEAVAFLSNWWLTYWSRHANVENQFSFLGTYAIINVSAALAGVFRMVFVALVSLKASRKLFDGLLNAVLYAPMSFFDTTPVGRLVNRFSKDIYTIDEQLVQTLRMYLQTVFSIFSTFVVISGVTPTFLVGLVPLCLFYISEQRFFTLTYRELKRLDSILRSPIYALLGESIDGVACIRAFSAQKSLTDRLKVMLDAQQHAYFLTCTAQSWLAVRLELIGTLVITFATTSAVVEHAMFGADETFAGLAGLAISYALSVTQSLNWSVRMASDLEANMVAVERVQEYSQIYHEGLRNTELDEKLPLSWPTHGEIVFKGAKMRYRPNLPLVLKGLDLHIPAGSKIGVVGRTGAGKSTLMVALMRIVELDEGSISIDGVDIRQVGLGKLRRNVAVLPQDPVLFSGTIRSNLDPFDEFSDEQLHTVLESVGLYKRSMEGSMHSHSSLSLARVDSIHDEVAEGGLNYSVGQRQLVVIARALLQGAKIVIIDEATAAVDAETDAAIQRVLRVEFANATCLTVAHRLNTIMDSDFILVMDDGTLAEFDQPDALIRKGGLFRDLVKAASHD